MKFKSDIEIQARVEAGGSTGDPGQILSSTGSGVAWIDQNAIGAATDFVFFNVKNETGSTISKGKGVMAVGTDGNSGHILVDEMVADGTVESKYFLGVLEEDIANGAFARVISFGQLSQFDTRGQNGETWADGQVLWCDPANNGDFTITEPDGPNVKIAAAFILNSSTNGKIQVRVQANEGIHDLHDTKITSQVDGDVLVWDNTTGVWFNDSTLNVDYTNSRVGIGTTSPSQDLHINDADGNSLIRLSGGAANNETYEIGQGIAAVSNGGFGFYNVAEGKYAMVFQDATSNVGIDTTNPSHKLHVHSNTDNDYVARFEGSTNNSAGVWTGIGIGGEGNNTKSAIIFEDIGESYSRGKLHLAVNNELNQNSATKTDAKLTISNTGNVGIGTTSPGDKLDIESNHSQLRLTDSDDSTFTQFSSSGGKLAIRQDSTSASHFWLTSDGNVGIGTNSPGVNLEIHGTVNTDNCKIYLKENNTFGSYFKYDGDLNRGYIGGITDTTSENSVMSWSRDGTDLSLVTSGSVALKIDSDRNVGIGTTSPSNKLHVKSDGNEGIFMEGTGGGHWFNFKSGLSNLWSMGAQTGLMGWYNRTDSTYKMVITDTGNVGIGTTSPGDKLTVSGGDIRGTESIFAEHDIRAPFMYDLDDTAFYVNPNNTSRINNLNVIGDATVTGTINASNFSGTSSGTNTGDQDLSGYLTIDGTAADSNLLDGIDSSGFVKQLSNTSSPNYTTPSSRRVNPNATNPTNEHYAITTFGNDGNVTGQLATHFVSGLPYTRGFNASWSAWRKIWTDANDGSGSGLDADTLDGQHASAFQEAGSYQPAGNYVTTDTTQTVSGAKTFSSGANHYKGHLYYDPYDANGNHYPHFLDGGNANGVNVNWRLYSGSSLITHTWNYTDTNFANSLRSNVDMRAPIFYDSNNTVFYVNPASTSQLNYVDAYRFRDFSDTSYYLEPHSISYLNDIRPNIMYDRNDTAYYVNPASTSVLDELNVKREQRWFRDATNNAHQRVDGRLDGSDQARLHWYGKDDSDNTRNFKHAWYDGSNYINVTAASSVVSFVNTSPGYTTVTADGDMRAPIFYDLDNTAYYGNFAGNSRYNTAQGNHLGLGTAAPSTTSGYRLSIASGGIHMNNNAINYVTQLHFNDNVRFYDEGNDNYLNFKYGDAVFGGIKFLNGGNTLKGYIYATDNSFGLLDNDGQWAVRTQTGTSPLTLYCDNNPEFYVYTSYTYSPGSSRAPIFYDSNNTAYYINPSNTNTSAILAGKVGIGTTNPGYKLDVNGSFKGGGIVADPGPMIFTYNEQPVLYGYIGFGAVPAAALAGVGDSGINSEFPASEAIRIAGNGSVGIGTTSPSSTAKLHVVGNGAGASSIEVDNVIYGQGVKFNRNGNYGGTACSFRNGTTQVGAISIGTSSTFYSTSSDYRLKENVTPIESSIDRLMQLNPLRFNFISEPNVTVDGFLAHEVQDVVPESVLGEKDEVDGAGNEIHQSIDQSKLVPLLTAALQDAITKIEQLETRIQTLENNN